MEILFKIGLFIFLTSKYCIVESLSQDLSSNTNFLNVPALSTNFKQDSSDTIAFLQIGDWGGQDIWPFYTPSQKATAKAMAAMSSQISASFVLVLGDNFYDVGMNDFNSAVRFQHTFENVYNAPSLHIPWYVIAGNHDHFGNVSLQIEYTKISNRWTFPSLYHKHSIYSADGSIQLDIILIDTTTYTGVNIVDEYPAEVADMEQHLWLKDALETSTADFILVAGHYPVYSACPHGNTETLIQNLKPLLDQHHAHYFAGHEHCLEHLVSTRTNYWVNGIGHGCCYHASNQHNIPHDTSLDYLLSNPDPVDDMFIEMSVDDTIGGYASVIIVGATDTMTVTYYNQYNEVLYTSYVLSRKHNSALSSISSYYSGYFSMWMMTMIFMIILSVFVVVLFGRFSTSHDDVHMYMHKPSSSYSSIFSESFDSTHHDTELVHVSSFMLDKAHHTIHDEIS